MLGQFLNQFNEDASKADFGLKRFCFLVILYNVLLSLWCLLVVNKLFFQSLFLIGLCHVLLYFRKKIIDQGKYYLMGAHVLLLVSEMWWNYEVIGRINYAVGGFPLNDYWTSAIDYFLLGNNPAKMIQNFLSFFAPFDKFIYDCLMVSYILYFLLPFLVIFNFFFEIEENSHYFIGRIISSFILLFMFNFTCYLIVPVTGPQDFLSYVYAAPIPFSFVGESLHHVVFMGRANLIDCFPSGHMTISLLATYWMFRLNLSKKYAALTITLLISIAIIALRYHYIIDAVAAIPLILFSYYIARFVYPWGDRRNIKKREAGGL